MIPYPKGEVQEGVSGDAVSEDCHYPQLSLLAVATLDMAQCCSKKAAITSTPLRLYCVAPQRRPLHLHLADWQPHRDVSCIVSHSRAKMEWTTSLPVVWLPSTPLPRRTWIAQSISHEICNGHFCLLARQTDKFYLSLILMGSFLVPALKKCDKT